jgi:excisionase family DNA binding protein
MRNITSDNSQSPAQLAKFWGCSRKTILRIIKRGELPAVRIGPQEIRVMKVDSAAYYARQSVNLSPVVPGLTKGRVAGRRWGS